MSSLRAAALFFAMLLAPLLIPIAPVSAADFCLSAAQVQQLHADLSQMTLTTVNGVQMYCGSNPAVPSNGTVAPGAGCPAGTSPITTQADLLLAQQTLPTATMGMCWNRNDASTGADAGQAKQDLTAMRCDTGVDIEHLDAKFAVCADKFMQQLRQASPRACIGSAYRDPQQQLKACLGICGQSSCPGKCAPPGHSYHQKGLAVDVNGINNMQQAWQIAAQNGIINPPGLHQSDAHHFQSYNSNCAGAPVPTNDNGDYYNDTGNFFPPQQSSFPFDNQLRSLLGAATQPQLPPPPTPTPAPAPTPISPTPSSTSPGQLPDGTCVPKFYCTNGTYYYHTSACVDQPYQKCPNGCDSTGSSCLASSTSNTGGSLDSSFTDTTNTDTNSNTNDNTNSNNPTSSISVINSFAYPTSSSVDIGSSILIDISQAVASTGARAQLEPGSPGYVAASGTTAIYYGQTGHGDTFTSNDLTAQPVYTQSPAGTYSVGVLATLKNILLTIAQFLIPFGGTPASYAT